jgi:hypothetical protein
LRLTSRLILCRVDSSFFYFSSHKKNKQVFSVFSRGPCLLFMMSCLYLYSRWRCVCASLQRHDSYTYLTYGCARRQGESRVVSHIFVVYNRMRKLLLLRLADKMYSTCSLIIVTLLNHLTSEIL